jgi:transposase
LIQQLEEDSNDGITEVARSALLSLVGQLANLTQEIRTLDRKILAWHRSSETTQRLATIPGVGVLTATAMGASVTDPSPSPTRGVLRKGLGLEGSQPVLSSCKRFMT